MRQISLFAVIAPAAMLLVGCSAEEVELAEGPGEFEIIGTEEIPKEFINGKGQRFVLRGPAKFVDDPVGAPQPVPSDEASGARSRRTEDQMTREELAHALRPVTLYKGHEYILEGPAYELADAIIATRGKELKTQGSRGIAPGMKDVDLKPSLTQPQIVLGGSDQREQKRDNTTFPSRTRVLITTASIVTDPETAAKCSGQLIGPTTILTAAHCLHNGTGWYGTRSWSPGVDSQDSNPFPYQGGSVYPDPSGTAPIFDCYHAVIPNEYLNGDTSVSHDFAILELSSMYPGNCNLEPGTLLGWHGLWVASESAIEDRPGYIYGYPGESAKNFPQIWGYWGPLSDEGVSLEYEIDTTAGQSGSAIYKFDSADVRYVVGVHKGYNGDGANYGRRMTTGLYNWILNHSAL